MVLAVVLVCLAVVSVFCPFSLKDDCQEPGARSQVPGAPSFLLLGVQLLKNKVLVFCLFPVKDTCREPEAMYQEHSIFCFPGVQLLKQ